MGARGWAAAALLAVACAAGPEPRPRTEADVMRKLASLGFQSRPGTASDMGKVLIHLAPPERKASVTPPGDLNGQLFIAAQEAWNLLAVDIQDGPERLRVPPALRRPGMRLWAVFRICANQRGLPSSVMMMTSADPLVNDDWKAAARRWRFRPFLQNGVATAFCSDMPIEAEVVPLPSP